MQVFEMRKKDDAEAEILLYEVIGMDWRGSSKRFVEDLTKLGPLSKLNLRINSPGGSVFEGLAIYNALVRHAARVTVHVDGIAGSIASVVAMAGDEIKIAANAMFMIHKPFALTEGTAGELRAIADLLDKTEETIVGIYAGRTKQEPKKISKMLATETWLNAEEAVAGGFADEVVGAFEPKNQADVLKILAECDNPAARKWLLEQTEAKPAPQKLSAMLADFELLRAANAA